MPLSILRAGATGYNRSSLEGPMTPQATSGGWPTNDGTLSASSPLPAKSEARVQDELDQTPLIVRLRHRERRVVLGTTSTAWTERSKRRGDRLHLLRRRCNDLRPAEEVWRAWQAEHKPDLDRLLATLRLRISLAENLRRRPSLRPREAGTLTLELQPEPDASIDVSI